MVFRCYTEKRSGFDGEAQGIAGRLRADLGLPALTGLRLFHRYDAQGVGEADWLTAQETVFSDLQTDWCYDQLPPIPGPHRWLLTEAVPGQFDQRADSAAQCLQVVAGGERPLVAYATAYALLGELTDADMERVRRYLINPVERREAARALPHTLAQEFPKAAPVKTVEGLRWAPSEGLEQILADYGLAMNLTDLLFLQSYFRDEEDRDPTVTELRVIDTYWSDHCRHTTFLTRIDKAEIADPAVQAAYAQYQAARAEVYGAKAETRPETLMDIATIGTKVLKQRGYLKNLDESEEVNACSIRVKVQVEGQEQDWLLLFKNETHNHPTEIEPFGGAGTCVGGCIRDPLSGRAYAYQAMRLTGAGDPRVSIADTLPGKLPQRQLTTTAAVGYSSYGNQVGVPSGLVHEFYHPG
jgi:phosphoribosylformylglycinamidine synthase